MRGEEYRFMERIITENDLFAALVNVHAKDSARLVDCIMTTFILTMGSARKCLHFGKKTIWR